MPFISYSYASVLQATLATQAKSITQFNPLLSKAAENEAIPRPQLPLSPALRFDATFC